MYVKLIKKLGNYGKNDVIRVSKSMAQNGDYFERIDETDENTTADYVPDTVLNTLMRMDLRG